MLFCIGSVPIKNDRYKNIKQTTTYIDWKLSNDGCYGCASFYWKVNRTYDFRYSTYYYNIYFYSNSFYSNGAWASTYLTGIYVNVDGYYINKRPVWLLFKDVYSNELTSFYTVNSNPTIKITWTGMSIY